MNYNFVTILGPTASGKTKLAAKLCYKFDGEIISADSRQVYKGMNIGTGKDYDDYVVEGKKTPYHLIDLIEPTEEFNLFLFKNYFFSSINDIQSRKKIPFLVGGTGLYLSSVLQNYSLSKTDFDIDEFKKLNLKTIDELQNILFQIKPKQHNTTDLIDKERIVKAILVAKSEEDKNEVNNKNEFCSLTIGINIEKDVLKKCITERLKNRLQSGMIEEIESLLQHGISFEKLNFFGLEYRYISLYLQKKITYNDMFQKLNSSIHKFAKRQMTWFRKMEREGIKINWLEKDDLKEAENLIKNNFCNE